MKQPIVHKMAEKDLDGDRVVIEFELATPHPSERTDIAELFLRLVLARLDDREAALDKDRIFLAGRGG